MQALFIADKFPIAEVNVGFEMVNTISRMGADFLSNAGGGGDRIIKMLGSLGNVKANPIGALHTLNDMKARGYLTDGVKFEATESVSYFKTDRRTDVRIIKTDGDVLRVEYKGSKSLGGRVPYNNNEFLNDVMIFLDKGEDFEWVLAKGFHDLGPMAAKMKNGLNSELLKAEVAKKFTKDTRKYNDAIEKIKKMNSDLNTIPNKYLRLGEY